MGIALFISHYAPKDLALFKFRSRFAHNRYSVGRLWFVGALVPVPHMYPVWSAINKSFRMDSGVHQALCLILRTVLTVAVVLAVMVLPDYRALLWRDIFVQTPLLQQKLLALGATEAGND